MVNPSFEILRPVLARHARFRWDAVRRQHEIVFPEGVLVLNAAGAAIVERCDGRPIEALIASLEAEVAGGGPASDVPGFVRRLAEKGLLCEAPKT